MLTITTDLYLFTILHRIDIEFMFVNNSTSEFKIGRARLNGAPITLEDLPEAEKAILDGIVQEAITPRGWKEHA